MLLFVVSFVAGVLTILAPCTVSLLPVIVGGTASGGTSARRAFMIVLSLGASIFLFTLALKVSSALIAVPQSFWQGLSGGIIALTGLSMLFPALWENLPFLDTLGRGGNTALAVGYRRRDMLGDMLVGAALGPVFSSCSPTYFLILAAVLPKNITEGLIYLLTYLVGLTGALFLAARAGQTLLMRMGTASNPRGWIKRGIGVVFIALGIVIFLGYDRSLELFVAEHVFDVTTVERGILSSNASGRITPPVPQAAATSTPETAPPGATESAAARSARKARQYPRAPEIANPSGFINTGGAPVTLGRFAGKKVVLVDFWTYSCINCVRTLPYVKAWYAKYRDRGLEIVSVHTPEFGFEKLLPNVQAAVKSFGIAYPVVLDNDYGTWSAFGNQFWPRKYLIDIDGFIVYDHAGEGAYDETERAIQRALAERARTLGTKEAMPGNVVAPEDAVTVAPGAVQSPETYFGSARNEYLDNGAPGTPGAQQLALPASFALNTLYLGGAWTFSPEYASASAGARIVYRFRAKDVYFVASSARGAKLSIFLDGSPIGAARGSDVSANGTTPIKEDRLYKIVRGADYGTHTLEIRIESGTLDAYTFTFG